MFKLAKANSSQVRNIRFLLSCKKNLENSLEYIGIRLDPEDREAISEDFTSKYHKMMEKEVKLEKSLFDLQLFCYNKLHGYISLEHDYDKPYTMI